MQGEGELISGDGWISDDSSFYGDGDEQEQLHLRCQQFDPVPYWSTHETDLNAFVSKAKNMPPVKLHNIYEGNEDARQLHETIDDFLERLPPLTTSLRVIGPWIWVANPYPDSQGKCSRVSVDQLTERGHELMEQSLQTRHNILTQNPSKSKAAVTQMLDQEGDRLKQRITDLAGETNVLSGKWMLFPRMEDLTRVWRRVAEGTIENRLGSSAKVATDGGGAESRLICVYTKDFRDTDDVRRVLQELVAMGLVDGASRGIYYKSDLYTYLDIYGKNASDYGLQASLYSSQKMLSSTQGTKQGPPTPQKKQVTLDGFRRI